MSTGERDVHRALPFCARRETAFGLSTYGKEHRTSSFSTRSGPPWHELAGDPTSYSVSRDAVLASAKPILIHTAEPGRCASHRHASTL